VWDVATRALGAPLPTGEHPTVNPKNAAMLVLELAYADEALTPEDRALIEQHLRERWGLEAGAGKPSVEPGRFEQYRERLAERFSRPQRLALVEGMWHAAFGDGAIGAQEERVMRRAGELLGLSPAEIGEALRRSRQGAEAGK
jgi:uncharacterized tellurite resistance protein B-like protein